MAARRYLVSGDIDPRHWREGGWYCDGCAACEVCQSPRCSGSSQYGRRAADLRGLIVQDPCGYPAPGDPLEPAPPDGPPQPAVHTAVLAVDYEALEAEVAARDAIVEAPRATTSTLGWVTTAFRKLDEGTPGSPPHVSADNAKNAYERGMGALRQYDALTGRCCGGGRAPCPTHYITPGGVSTHG